MFEAVAAEILSACARGGLPAGVGLMRLVMAASEPDEVERLLAGSDGGRPLLELWRAHPRFWTLAKAMQETVDHRATSDSAATAEAFDRAAAISAEAASALYALGDSGLLEQATAEVADLVAGLSGPRPRVLDIGCGAGRFEVALAPRAASILGLEASGEMAAAARRRCAGLSNVEITLCPRGAPPGLAPARFDLAIAVDVFPYIVQCGGDLAGIWFEAVARALAPGGSFVVCNFSYRGDLQADVDQAAALARAGGLRPVRMGARPFRCWDGALFHFERRPPRAQGTTPARGR